MVSLEVVLYGGSVIYTRGGSWWFAMAFRFEASLLTMQQDESLSKRAHDAPETHYITSHA
ncbi:hypothetical protein TanjilG_06306 [Lupinus angustifolius]|uniref:Uncharacterized protein n=1 Tax=Lupinus angustifolius TaxID=3871 RepID=A0A394DF36_LUPAN|nr:hypothetical protein TanjilG_06306 [Lupinus angustifolius]